MSTTEWVTHEFKTLEEFGELIPSMNDADSRQIHVDGVSKKTIGGMWYPGYQAIVNKQTDEVAQITKDSYKILGHRNFFAAVKDLLEDNELECHGKAIEIDNGNRWIVKCIFDDVYFEEPGYDGKNIQVGASFVNSYNGKSSASGRAYYMRLSCMNQMVLKNVIPECMFARNHKAKDELKLIEDVTIGLENFVANLLSSGLVFKETVERARSRKLSFRSGIDDIEATFQKILGVPAHGTVAAQMAAEEYHDPEKRSIEMSYWDTYNVFTQFLSHTEGLSPNVEERLQGRIERALLAPKANVVPLKVKA